MIIFKLSMIGAGKREASQPAAAGDPRLGISKNRDKKY